MPSGGMQCFDLPGGATTTATSGLPHHEQAASEIRSDLHAHARTNGFQNPDSLSFQMFFKFLQLPSR